MYLRLKNKDHLSIKKSNLYWLSILCALASILGLIDSTFFSFNFSHSITNRIGLHWYALLFGFPHILASLTSFQAEKHFKSISIKSQQKLILILSTMVAVYFFSINIFSAIFLFLVSTHITGQSIGILNFWSNDFQKLKKFWFYLNSITLAVGLINIYTGNLKVYLIEIYPRLIEGALLLSLLNFLVAFFLMIREKNKKARYLYLITQINLFGLFYLPVQSNILFSTILFILNHDLIAFYFYFSHRINADRSLFNGLAMILIVVTLTGLIGWSIIEYKIPQIILIFQVIHYIVEKRIWKANSLHRQYITVEA